MANREFPRAFVADGEVLDAWEKIEPYFDRLRERPLDSVDALEKWLTDYSELIACVDEVGTDRVEPSHGDTIVAGNGKPGPRSEGFSMPSMESVSASGSNSKLFAMVSAERSK